MSVRDPNEDGPSAKAPVGHDMELLWSRLAERDPDFARHLLINPQNFPALL
jgi:hypothetical protein